VKVQILVDGINGMFFLSDSSHFKQLVSHEQVEARFYNPIDLFRPWRTNYRMHDKYLIADDWGYILGGRNTDNRFLGYYKESYNEDRDLLVYGEKPGQGSSFQALEAYFHEIWNQPCCKEFDAKGGIGGLEQCCERVKERYPEAFDRIYSKEDWEKATMEFSKETLIPQFNLGYFTSLSILVFAVGGCEKISPYVNKVKDPSRGFPKGMIALAIMVMVCAILGTIAMGMMFDPTVINESSESFNSYVSNGAYWSFQKLGEYYHVGNLLLIIYAACNAIGQFSTLVLSIDAPLRMLLDNEDARQFVPTKLLKKNQHGAYINGIFMVAGLSGSIILIQSFVPGAAAVLTQLNKLNSVTMPLRYLWVFVAYIALRKAADKFHPEYRFVKNQGIALTAGIWCFVVTAFCCIFGMYVEGDPASTALNVITPFVLTALGLILPIIKKNEKAAG
jgi:hypothetical protein